MTASTYLILCHLAPTKCRMSVRFSDIETTGCPGDAGWHIVVERPGHKSNPLATPCVIDFLQKTRGTQPAWHQSSMSLSSSVRSKAFRDTRSGEMEGHRDRDRQAFPET